MLIKNAVKSAFLPKMMAKNRKNGKVINNLTNLSTKIGLYFTSTIHNRT